MKKTFRYFVIGLLLSGLFLNSYFPAQAQDETGFVPFSAMGYTDELMLGPYSNMQVRFGIPASWSLQPGSKIRLNIEVTATDPGQTATTTNADNDFTGATLEVTFNDVLVDLLLLTKGTQVLDLEIPAAALTTSRIDGRHDLNLFLDAGIDCLSLQETSVMLRASSGFVLEHTTVVPAVNLIDLPRPIYQLDSIQPEPLVIVLPDQPSAQEVQSALTIAAGFGRLTTGLQAISVTNVGGLTEVQKSSSHIAFVGKAAELPILEEVALPTEVAGATAVIGNVQPTDGVLQIANSPWNSAFVVLHVGGDSDESVVKAAQAVSSGQVRGGLRPDIAVITNVAAALQSPEVATDRTLSALGYVSETMGGVGFQSLEYNFYVPFGQVAGEESYIDLIYSHSALLDFSGSGITVDVNGQVVGSVRLTEETSQGITSARISIPAYVVHPGNNTLTIVSEFIPSDICSELNRDGLWLTVHDYSLLHMPLLPASVNPLLQARDLSQYPFLFTLDPTLSNLAFVMPADDVQSWNIGAQLASFLGREATGEVLNPTVAFGDMVTDEVKSDRDLIIIGRATQLPIIAELGEALPSPFSAGSDMAIEKGMQVSYLIPEGTNLGYVQLLPAPWNTAHTILAVMGSTPTGLDWSAQALVTSNSIQQLRGTFAVINGPQILTSDTRLGLGTQNLSATAIAEEVPSTLNPTPIPGTPVQQPYRQDLILVAIIVVSVLTLLMLIVFVIASRRRSN